MRRFWIVALGFVFLPTAVLTQEKGSKPVPAVLKFQMKDIDGKNVDLAKYQGKVILFVNVASECGYTDQYKPLQALHAKYAKEGLAISASLATTLAARSRGPKNRSKNSARASTT